MAANSYLLIEHGLQGESGMRLRSVVPHQELAMAGALDDLRHVTACHPASVEAQQHTLLGVALARGRHMSEVSELKQKNLQVWLPCSVGLRGWIWAEPGTHPEEWPS